METRSHLPLWHGLAQRFLDALKTAELETFEPPVQTDLNTAAELPVWQPKVEDLLLIFRLAATLGGQDPVELLTPPGAITVIDGIAPADLTKLRKRLSKVLVPPPWQICEADYLRTAAPQLVLITPPNVDSGDMSAHNLRRMIAAIEAALDLSDPILILLPTGIALPPELVQGLPPALPFAPMTRDVVMAVLRTKLAADGDCEPEIFSALPPDPVIADLSPAVLRLAIRSGSVAQAVHQIADSLAPQARTSGPTLEDMPGNGPALQTARRLVSDLKAWQQGRITWGQMTRSVLLYGPPGTGKTYLARALGQSADIAFVEGSFAAWQAAGHLGDMLAAMRKTFAKAVAARPSVLFIDEVDSAGSRFAHDTNNRNYRTQVINGLLQEIDALNRQEGVLLMGACNQRNTLDPAILRPGRFDLHVEMPLPDAEMIAGILARSFAAHPADMIPIACHLVGKSAAEVDALIREGQSRARAEGREFALSDLGHLMASQMTLNISLLRRVAVHECGHAIVGHAFYPGSIARIQTGFSGGVTLTANSVSELCLADLEALLAQNLAGRAAERLVFGNVSAGSGGGKDSDLAKATTLAINIDRSFGLGADGPVWSGDLGTWALQDLALVARVRERLDSAERVAADILVLNHSLLEDMSTTLMDMRELAGPDLHDWLSRVQGPKAMISGA